MNELLETHFKLIDFTKNLLLNSTNEHQENQARRILELSKKQENIIEIN